MTSVAVRVAIFDLFQRAHPNTGTCMPITACARTCSRARTTHTHMPAGFMDKQGLHSGEVTAFDEQ